MQAKPPHGAIGRNAKDAGRYSDGNGFYLAVRPGGSRQWAFIYRRDGKLSCLLCGKAEQGRDPLLPFETERTGHAWLHSHCWWAWSAARHAEGRCRFSGTGILAPVWFQTISIKMEARDGRLRIGTAGRSRQGRSLPFNRRKLATSPGLPARRLNGQLPMVARRRQGHPDEYACRA